MRVGFRVWMAGVAVLIVLLTVVAMLLYALPVAGGRLEGYDLDRLTSQAAQTADAIAEGEGQDLRRSLDLAADPDDQEALFVDREGRVVERAGPGLLSDEPEVLREAADGGAHVPGDGGTGRGGGPCLLRGRAPWGVGARF